MALRTFGSTTTTVLRAVQWQRNNTPVFSADVAALNIALLTPNSGALGPLNPQRSVQGDGVTHESKLYLPAGRGIITLQPGDWVVFDPATGWPFVVSSLAVSVGGTNWAHS